MNPINIIVKTTSSNLWWGIYGLTTKISWEDLNLFYGNEEKIGSVCLNTKKYLRDSLPDLQNDKDELEFITAVRDI